MNNGLGRSGRDLILNRATVPTLDWSDWGIQPKSQSRYPISGPRFEPGTSRMWSGSCDHSTATFDRGDISNMCPKIERHFGAVTDGS
jgi:hypothetical protein